MDGCENTEAKASSGRLDHRYMFIRYSGRVHSFQLLLARDLFLQSQILTISLLIRKPGKPSPYHCPRNL